MKFVKEFVDGDKFNGIQLLVVDTVKGTMKSGTDGQSSTYLNIELRDASGTISGKKWNSTSEDDKLFVAGNVVAVDLEVYKYKDNLQAKIYNATLVDLDDIDATKLVKQSPVPKEELIKRFKEHINSIKDETCLALLKYFINKYKDKILDYPAASSIHHEFASGLLTHMVYMADLAGFIAKLYKDVDYDLLITGTLLHDLGKITELESQSLGIYHYSLEGKLLGHISIMVSEIRNAAKELNLNNEKVVLLEHMVLSHHGQLEFGSPVLPQTKEALILSLIDNMDSKIVIATKALENIEKGEYSQKIYPLDGRTLYKPKD